MVTAKYERAGKPTLPKWWTDIVWPMLDNENYGRLALRASELAGRESPWRGDSITKFRQGSAVTRELANAISQALGVAVPFWEAKSEQEALAFGAIRVATTQPTVEKSTPDRESKRTRVATALEGALSDKLDQTRRLTSKDAVEEGSSRSPGSRRASSRRRTPARS